MKTRRTEFLFIVAMALFFVPFLSGCPGTVSDAKSGAYKDVARAFTVGLAALQVGEDDRALRELTRATEMAPDEPASWANLGLLQLRQGRLEEAATNLNKAATLAPQNSPIAALVGLMEARRGNYPTAIASLKKAVELDPKNIPAKYSLVQEIQRQGDATAETEAEKRLIEILADKPDNLAVLLELLRGAARRGDRATVQRYLPQIASRNNNWPPEAQQQLQELQAAANGPDVKQAATRVAFLRNVLQRVPEFRKSMTELEGESGQVGQPILDFVKLPKIPRTPALPDTGLTYTVENLTGFDGGTVRAAYLTGEGNPALFVPTSNGPQLLTATPPASASPTAPVPVTAKPVSAELVSLDWNYDFRTDFLQVGVDGLTFYQQQENGTFTNVTAQTKLPPTILKQKYLAAYSADVDMEGDLDIVVLPFNESVKVLQNNGDGTFVETDPFVRLRETGGGAVTDFAWADIDGDGDPDAVFSQGEQTRVLLNERGGQFLPLPAGNVVIGYSAQTQPALLVVTDVNNDGLLDVLGVKGAEIFRVQTEPPTNSSMSVGNPPKDVVAQAGVMQPLRIFAADMDNNGVTDLITTDGKQSRVLLANERGKFMSKDAIRIDLRVDDVADVNGDGLLDLVGSVEGKPVQAVAKGTKNYHYIALRPKAAETTGDQRINSFGIGGEMEVRAGLLAQKRPIAGPRVHFGLGEQTQADIVRIIWPNGSLRGEFELKGDQTVVAEQRLKGSCPFLFAWNGREMAFVTDCIWRSPLGLRINAQNTAGVAMTEDWVKLRADQLQPRTDENGESFYDLRITADLWETHFFDHLGLMTVDHPEGTEIWVDERFAIPPPPLAVVTTGPVTPVHKATADTGEDITEIVAKRDGKYADYFGRGRYQGVTRDHALEIDLGPDAKKGSGPLYLIAHGWIHPTDSSINVALGQGKNAPPSGLTLEVPNGLGGWKTAKTGLGFPTGKVKTVVLRVEDVLGNGTKLRLRTNLEIFWDSLGWAKGAETAAQTQRLTTQTANLQYRGFTTVKAVDKSSPELPVAYEPVESRTQRWRDLEGYYTRFGNVNPLLTTVDDRYVIMNAGDEIRLRFPVPPPPKPGYVRDFVLIGDGWVKDGDYNTTFSKTVLPLPSHATPDYFAPPTELENDPVYQAHKEDWQSYHTRYVTPEVFRNALRLEEIQRKPNIETLRVKN